MSGPLVEAYPPFGLWIIRGDMTLRALRDVDMSEYFSLLSVLIFAEENVDWFLPWCEALVPERRRNAIQAHWGWRSGSRSESRTLAFGVYAGGVLIGRQDLLSEDFPRRRVVHSGSWLALEHQGRGWGPRMCRLLLHFASDHLGAQWTEPEAVAGNESLLGVSHSAGYEPSGAGVEIFGKRVVKIHHVAPTLDRFHHPDGEIVVEGFTDELHAMMGVGPKGISLQRTGLSILSRCGAG